MRSCCLSKLTVTHPPRDDGGGVPRDKGVLYALVVPRPSPAAWGPDDGAWPAS